MIFAIKDKDTDLYYNRNTHKLTDLEQATWFNSWEYAKHFKSIAQHQLAWSYLENKYKQDKWHIDPSFEEWVDAMNLFKNLKVVETYIDEFLEMKDE